MSVVFQMGKIDYCNPNCTKPIAGNGGIQHNSFQMPSKAPNKKIFFWYFVKEILKQKKKMSANLLKTADCYYDRIIAQNFSSYIVQVILKIQIFIS